MDNHQLPESGGDLNRPSTPRIYDYLLGGSQNFEADREVGREVLSLWPEATEVLRHNREFLHRAVDFMSAQGIDQFIDIGSGMRAHDNTHDFARAMNPAARVVYVDSDPVIVAHSRTMLLDDDLTAIVEADLRDPFVMLDSAEVADLIDFAKPVGLLLAAVLHFIDDADDPAGLVAALASRVAPGSYLAISHATAALVSDRAKAWRSQAPFTFQMRSPAEVAALFGPFELVPPGVVTVSQWAVPATDVQTPSPAFSEPAEPCHCGVGKLGAAAPATD